MKLRRKFQAEFEPAKHTVARKMSRSKISSDKSTVCPRYTRGELALHVRVALVESINTLPLGALNLHVVRTIDRCKASVKFHSNTRPLAGNLDAPWNMGLRDGEHTNSHRDRWFSSETAAEGYPVGLQESLKLNSCRAGEPYLRRVGEGLVTSIVIRTCSGHSELELDSHTTRSRVESPQPPCAINPLSVAPIVFSAASPVLYSGQI